MINVTKWYENIETKNEYKYTRMILQQNIIIIIKSMRLGKMLCVECVGIADIVL